MRFYFSLMVLFAGFTLNGLPARAYVDEMVPKPEVISAFKPIYFLVGSPHTKIQLSLKAQLVEAAPIYLAYTQTSFWDIFRASAPFSDTSYSPEIFYRDMLNQNTGTWIDFGGQHESNGRDGPDSRAWNRVYARFSTTEDLHRAKIFWSVQAWVPFPSKDLSTDLPQYRGIFELTATYSDFLGPFFDHDDLTLRLFPGGSAYLNPFLGGQELTLRLKSANRKFLPLLIFEMFHGYGESLLDYKDDVWVGRIGVGL